MLIKTATYSCIALFVLSSCGYETGLDLERNTGPQSAGSDAGNDAVDDIVDDAGDDTPCHPLSLETCCLPMPSNTYTVESVDECFSEEALQTLPDSLYPSKLLEERDGWSPSMPVFFEAPYEVDAQALPLDGGDVLKVYDLSDPEMSKVPVRVRISQIPEIQNRRNPPANPHVEPAQVIEAFPRSRFPFGHRLVAVLTTALPSADESTVEAIELPPLYDDVVASLELRGLRRDEILSLTEFTIATEDNTTGKLFEMIDVVESQPHPVRNISAEYEIFETPETGAVLRGEVLLTNFRGEDGTIDFETGDVGEPDWTEFDLYIPHNARFGPVPLVLYGHGLKGSKSDARWIALFNSLNGVATIAIDWPNHGSRTTEEDGGYIGDNARPDRLGHLLGMWTQGVVDFHSLLAAVETTIEESSDVLPFARNIVTELLLPGYGRPDIDTHRVHYMGTSLGGVLGSGFVGSSYGINSAFLQVAGTGIARTMGLSIVFEGEFSGLIPEELTGPESVAFAYMMQLEVDAGDGNNLIHNVRPSGLNGHETPLVLQYGIGDSVVHNDSSLALAELAQLPVIWPDFEPIDYLGTSLLPVDGYALYQTDPTLGSDIIDVFMEPLIEAIAGPFGLSSYEHAMHASLILPRGMLAWEMWLLSM